jgi:hypothetical protein
VVQAFEEDALPDHAGCSGDDGFNFHELYGDRKCLGAGVF